MNTMSKIIATVAFIFSITLVGLFAQPAPALTTEQQLRIERVNLVSEVARLKKENADLQLQLTALQVAIERERLKMGVEKDNPGYTWDPSTGQFAAEKKP